jgi:hypothetical protein
VPLHSSWLLASPNSLEYCPSPKTSHKRQPLRRFKKGCNPLQERKPEICTPPKRHLLKRAIPVTYGALIVHISDNSAIIISDEPPHRAHSIPHVSLSIIEFELSVLGDLEHSWPPRRVVLISNWMLTRTTFQVEPIGTLRSVHELVCNDFV